MADQPMPDISQSNDQGAFTLGDVGYCYSLSETEGDSLDTSVSLAIETSDTGYGGAGRFISPPLRGGVFTYDY